MVSVSFVRRTALAEKVAEISHARSSRACNSVRDEWQDNLRIARGVLVGAMGGLVLWAALVWMVLPA